MSRARAIAGLLDASGQISSTYVPPAGVVLPFAGAAAPTGWLLCFGQAVSRTANANLFAAIGTVYGAGDGSTTFNLPDMRGRVATGKDDMGGTAANRVTSGGSGVNGAALGASGGAETHTLTTGQMPAHSHTATYDATAGTNTATNRVMTTSGGNGTGTFTSGSQGGGSAHNNVQPSLVLNHIIKT